VWGSDSFVNGKLHFAESPKPKVTMPSKRAIPEANVGQKTRKRDRLENVCDRAREAGAEGIMSQTDSFGGSREGPRGLDVQSQKARGRLDGGGEVVRVKRDGEKKSWKREPAAETGLEDDRGGKKLPAF